MVIDWGFSNVTNRQVTGGLIQLETIRALPRI